MNRVHLYANTRDSLPLAISGMQDYAETEKQRFFSQVFSSLGVASETDETGLSIHEADTNLKCTESGGTLTISPGFAITSGYHYIKVASTDTRTFTEGVDFDYTNTIYIRNVETGTRLVEQAKGYYLDTAGIGNRNTRVLDSWQMTTVDPGISGVALCVPVSNGVTTDLRASSLLKFNNKLADDTKIVKKDRDAEFDHNIILNSGLFMKDPISGSEFHISGLTELPGIIKFTGNDFVAAISGAHEHGAGNENLSRINTLTGSLWPDVNSFYNSGYVSSGGYYFLHDQNLRTVTTHPLYGFLQMGVVNYQDGHGERQVLTRKIASVPNAPDDLEFSLIQERAPEAATRKLRDAMRAYTFKEYEHVFNQSAYTALTAYYNDVAALAASSGYTNSSGIQTNAYLIAEASGLISAAYISGLVQFYLTTIQNDKSLEQVLSQISVAAGDYETAKATLDSDLDILSKDILTKGARMKVRPNAVVNTKYHARVSWTEPSLVDSEDIMGYDVRIYQYNADAGDPGSVTPSQLQASYSSDIVREQNVSTPRKRLTLTAQNNGAVDSAPTTTNSEDKPAWDQGLRVAITTASYASMSPTIGDYITINGETHILVKHGTDTGIGTQRYLQFAEAWDTVPSPSDVISCDRPTWDTTTANTSVVFPIDIDQAYIAYVRSVNEFNMASAWSTAVYQATNSLEDSVGIPLISGVQDDAEYLAEINRIERKQLTKTFENQILNLERTVAALPDNLTIANLVTQVTNLSAASS